MSKPEWPQVIRYDGKKYNAPVTIYRRVTASGNPGFRIHWRNAEGQRETQSTTDEAEALQIATTKSKLLSTHGVRVAETTPDEIGIYVQVRDLLAPRGVTVAAGCDYLNRWLDKFKTLAGIDSALTVQQSNGHSNVQITAKTVSIAVQEFITHHNGLETGELTIDDYETRLNRFAKKFTCDISTVTVMNLQEWLDGIGKSAATYEHFRRVLCTFFGWCFNRGYCAENIAFTPRDNAKVPGKRYIEKRDGSSNEETIVYPPETMKKLLAAAKDPEMIVLLGCRGQAGVRSSEFARLKWVDVDFEHDVIKIDPVDDQGKRKSKTKNRRLIPLSKNLRAALLHYRKNTGFIWTNRDDESIRKTLRRIYRAQQRLAENAGVTWDKNALRHSFCSYRLAIVKDAGQVAEEAGNSREKIHSNYRALSLPDGRTITAPLAHEWFDIEIPMLK